MPLVEKSEYRPGRIHASAHAATTLPTLLRRVPAVPFVRQRLEMDDGDFIDLDCWWTDGQGNGSTVVLCHGLEGNTGRQYMQGMARAFGKRGWNVVGMNYRGCSGQMNRTPGFYHSGATGDLRAVLEHVDRPDRPVRALVGFSLGGNLILKYLGEDPAATRPNIAAAVAFSVPTDLDDSEVALARTGNWPYRRRFLRKLAAKIRQKAAIFPDQIDPSGLDRVKGLRDFDDLYTAPLNGFRDADEYYLKCSSRQFLPSIQVPSLLISALDDPFLGAKCYPREEARDSACFHLETPARGGHVGFHQAGGEYWSEQRAVEFVTRQLG
jgi:predicted alpha/beta-fold hydrolase